MMEKAYEKENPVKGLSAVLIEADRFSCRDDEQQVFLILIYLPKLPHIAPI